MRLQQDFTKKAKLSLLERPSKSKISQRTLRRSKRRCQPAGHMLTESEMVGYSGNQGDADKGSEFDGTGALDPGRSRTSPTRAKSR
jgi:hypothetical protein